MTSPASTTTRSPSRELRAGHVLLGAVGAQPARDGLGLGPSQGGGLRLAAALGHRLGEVGEDDGQPQPDDDRPARTRLGSLTASTVESTAPTSTTNITGLRTITRGSSLRSGVRQRGQQHLRVEQARLDPGRGVGFGVVTGTVLRVGSCGAVG